jgi:hypothetical protein
MRMHPIFLTALLIASPASAQGTNDPFERPIAATEGAITVTSNMTPKADVLPSGDPHRGEQTRRDYPVAGSLTEGGHLRPGALP